MPLAHRGSSVSRKSSGTAEMISTSFGARAREYLAHASRLTSGRWTSMFSFTPLTSWSTISEIARTRACGGNAATFVTHVVTRNVAPLVGFPGCSGAEDSAGGA